jgi:hypothetical protein
MGKDNFFYYLLSVKTIIKLTFTLSLLFTAKNFLYGQDKTIQWNNGYWFNGTTFTPATFYSHKGLLTEIRPDKIDSIINLAGKYIVPPYGEAHNHAPESDADLEVFVERYLADGIFYIKNPNSIPVLTNTIREKINKPNSVDVVFANGGLTGSGGHPVSLYEHLKKTKYREALGNYSTMRMEGKAYYTINNKQEFEKKWPDIIADSPAFIKTYLLYSEEFEQRKNNPSYNGKKGMSPQLLHTVVKKAKASGLTVSCHVETPADVLNAIESGVTEINHLPGYQVRWKEDYAAAYYLLDDELVKLMKKKNVHADATYSLSETELIEKDSVQTMLRIEVQRANLIKLKQWNVPVTIGCDSYNHTARKEMEYLIKLEIYTPLELLKMWCETTPKVIFPKRNIAALKEGFEASFLALGRNPLEDSQELFDIKLRVKQGVILW